MDTAALANQSHKSQASIMTRT